MKFFTKIFIVVFVVLGFAGSTFAATTPSLGTAAKYGVLASTYTNIAAWTINGDVGYTTPPVAPPTINGATVTPKPPQAGLDQATALGNLNSQVCDFNFGVATDLSLLPQPLTPGVYCITAAASIGVGGITLNGAGTYVFRITGTLNTVANSIITLAGGADACDIFWTPTATTLGADSTFKGTVIDDAGITVGNNVTWEGRALNFATTITTNNDTITVPTCSVPSGTGTLHVIKNVINLGGGTAVASDFIISVHTSTGVFAWSGLWLWTPGTSYLLSSGTYTVTEISNSAYTTTFSLLLGNCLNFAISSGDDKTCTVLNTYIVPTPSGWGWWGWSLLIDVCPDWDYSTSYYDWICWLLPAAATQSIHIVKIANRLTPFPYGGGDVIYTYAVTNPDTTSISDVVVTDDKCSPLTAIGGDVNHDNLLDTDEVWTYTCSDYISVTTRNIATVVGEANGVTITDTDFANIVVELSVSDTPFVPKLPKTWLIGISTWKLALLGGIFLIFSFSFVVALRKRDL